jgi:hypothetical protein
LKKGAGTPVKDAFLTPDLEKEVSLNETIDVAEEEEEEEEEEQKFKALYKIKLKLSFDMDDVNFSSTLKNKEEDKEFDASMWEPLKEGKCVGS